MYQQVDEAKQVLEGIQSAESAEQLLSILRKKGAIPENVFDEKNFNPFLLWKDSEPAATQGKSIIKRLTGWKGLVDRSIDLLIDKYHYGFNTATKSFSTILEVFTECQQKVQNIEQSLESKRLQSAQTAQIQKSIRELYFQQQVHNIMVDTLDKIEYICTVPNLLDLLLNNRQYLHAVRLIQATLGLLSSPNLMNIDALQDIRKDILARRNALQDTLIDELHQVVYKAEDELDIKAKADEKRNSDRTDSLVLLANRKKSPQKTSRRSRSRVRDRTSKSSVYGIHNFSPTRSPEASPLRGRNALSPVQSSPQRLVENSKRYGQRGSVVGSDSIDLSSDSVKNPIQTKLQIATILTFETDKDLLIWTGKDREGSDTEVLYNSEEIDDFVRSPESMPDLFIAILIESLFRLGRLPSLVTSLIRRLSKEIKKSLEILCNQFRESIVSQKSDESSPESRTDSERIVELMESCFKYCTRILKHHQLIYRLVTARDSSAVSLGSGNVKVNRMEATPINPSKQDQKGQGDHSLFEAQARFSADHAVSPKRAYESESDYSISLAWEVIQSELCAIINEYVTVHQHNFTEMQITEMHKILNMDSLQFSFQSASIPSSAKMKYVGSKAAVQGKQPKFANTSVSIQSSRWIQSSPYLITSMYRSIVQFTDLASSMMNLSSNESNTGVLRSFVNDFIKVQFIPRVKQDINMSINEIFGGNLAFAIKEQFRSDVQRSKVPQGLINCVYSVVALIEKLFADFLLMPYDVLEFFEVVKTVVSKLTTKCQEKFAEITRSTFTSVLVNEAELLDLLRKDNNQGSDNPQTNFTTPSSPTSPLLNPIVGSLVTVKNLIGGAFKGVTAASSNQVVRDATERFIIFYIREHKESSKLADESEFMWEQSAYSTLASMIESLNWVQSRLVELSEPLSGYQSRVETLKLAGSKGSSIDFSKMMTDSITYLVERCLSTLRIEIRCHLLYFLTNIRTSSYYCDEEPTKPEKFVADSNRDLMRIDEKISRYLNPETKKKIFSGIPFVISHLVMEGLSKLSDKRINKNGVLKMSRNLFAMQQTLINILSASDDRIDRARQYWEILLEENTLEFTKSHPELFTPEEYRALLQINFIHEKPLHT